MNVIDALGQLLHLNVLVPWILGMVFGVFVGATPGLTATMAVALIVPMSFYMPPAAGLAMIIGVSFTAIFAGDIPATYLRIPGTPASAAATLDGHQLAKQGRAGLALTLDLLCSSLGGLIGVGLLILVAPQLARFALQFSNFEMVWLAVFGLSMSALVSKGSTFKAVLAVMMGMLFSTVGQDVVSGTPRYTFHEIEVVSHTFRQPYLMGGLELIPVMIGLFGISEVLRNVRDPQSLSSPSVKLGEKVSLADAVRQIWKYKWTVAKSSVIGTLIGALPGAGADIAAWGAYGIAQRTSKQPEQFGHGAIEGVIAPTSANNAGIAGAWIPALVFGVPGDAITAIVLGALLMYDIKPGPMIFTDSAEQIQTIFWIAAITQLFLLIGGFLGIKMFGLVLRLPRSVVLVAVVLFCVVGSYAMQNSMFDVGVMFAFGLLGYYLESQGVPVAPLILGLILGPMVEENLRTGLIKEKGDFMPFFTRPYCMVFFALLVCAVVARPGARLLRRFFNHGETRR